MKKVFLSFAFRDEDRGLVTAAEQLLASHDLVAVTGKRLAGEALTQAVMQRIEACDALVALLTRRDLKNSGKWTTHDWVRDELNHARTKGMHAVALLENEVEVSGAYYAEHERIPLDRGNPLEAFLALSETIGLWKREEGQLLIDPHHARRAGGHGEFFRRQPQVPVPVRIRRLTNSPARNHVDAGVRP